MRMIMLGPYLTSLYNTWHDSKNITPLKHKHKMTRNTLSLFLLVACCLQRHFATAINDLLTSESTYYGIANRLAAPEYRGKFVRVDLSPVANATVKAGCERLGLRDRHVLTWHYFEDWHKLPHRDIKGGYLGPGVSDFRVFDLPYDLADWMSRLKDESRLTALAIPGSHDSGSAQPEVFTRSVRTQEYSIIVQLLLGVRVFDIRPTRAIRGLGRDDGTLWTYHGTVFGQGLKTENLGRAVNCAKMFLEQYPSETVIFKLSHYLHTSENTVVHEISRSLGDMFVNPPTREGKEALTLRETRGKLLFLPEYHAERNQGPNGHDGTNDWRRMVSHLGKIRESRTKYNRFVVALTPQGLVDKSPKSLALKRGLPGLRDWLSTSASDKIGIVEADYFGSPVEVRNIIALIIEKNRTLGFFRSQN